MAEHERFQGLDFDGFRRLASAEGISDHERVGFPDSYRAGREEAILADILHKLPALGSQPVGTVVDIGSGCGPLASLIADQCLDSGHTLVLVDSEEMLNRREDSERIVKVAGRFPDCEHLLSELRGQCIAVLAYSVLQYAFTQPGVFDFVDAAAELLAPGGRLLLGDIPNASQRRRFLSSEAGVENHRLYTGKDESPKVSFNTPTRGEIDDGVMLGLVARSRGSGFHAWLVPQQEALPMANRREDLLIVRP